MTAQIAVVSAGLRSPSSSTLLADQLATEVAAQTAALGGQAQVHHLELRTMAHELADAMLTGFATGALREAIDTVTQADALVVVTPTFSASYSGLFKTFFDVIEPDELVGKPVLLAATGGTERHSLVLDYALRPLFAYLGAAPLRTGVYAATADFGGAGGPALARRIERAARELAATLAAAPARPDPVAAEDDIVPFEELIRRR